MKINSIGQSFYQCSNNSRKTNYAQSVPIQESKIEHTNFIPFMAIKPNGFKRPNIKDLELNKVFFLAKNLPNNCKVEEMRTITLNNEKFAYRIKKDSTGRTCVVIKNKIQEIADWGKTFEDQQLFECNFNSRGMLVGAKIIDKSSQTPLKVIFENTGHDGRRIDINEVVYKPIVGETSLWAVIPYKKSRCIVRKENIASILEENIFGSTLLELASKKASIALLKKQ